MEALDTIRVLLTVHYDGSAFHGWQYQPDQRTVQGIVQDALTHLTGEFRTVMGSGRTDTGVHATGQVAGVDVPGRWNPNELKRALNAILPEDIWVQSARAAALDFNPRFDALARTYIYKVGLAPGSASPIQQRWCWALCKDLPIPALAQAAAPLPGEHSFEAFSKSGQPERGYRCNIFIAEWSDWDLGAQFTITANRYLHHMVRYLVGTMIDIALGQRPSEDIKRLLKNESDVTTSRPAPPQGLFLNHVEYPGTVLLDQDCATSSPRSSTKP